MSKTDRPWNPDQDGLLPPPPRTWLPEGDFVDFLLDAVRTLDLSEIARRYEQEGRGDLRAEETGTRVPTVSATRTGKDVRRMASDLPDPQPQKTVEERTLGRSVRRRGEPRRKPAKEERDLEMELGSH